MTASDQPYNVLDVKTAVINNRPSTLLLIDGVDVLTQQQLTHRPDGSRYPSGPKRFYPADPGSLLPPDAANLLPARTPRQAIIGICDCAEPGCASLSAQVRRDGDVVIWEPDPLAQRSSVTSSWKFQLQPYLDALDAGHESTTRWETRPRLFARELRRRRDSLFGFSMGYTRDGTAASLLSARAWPSVDHVVIQAGGADNIRYLTVQVPAHLSDDEIITGIQTLDPAIISPWPEAAVDAHGVRGR